MLTLPAFYRLTTHLEPHTISPMPYKFNLWLARKTVKTETRWVKYLATPKDRANAAKPYAIEASKEEPAYNR